MILIFLRVGSHPECKDKFRSNCGLNDAQFAAMLESLGVPLEEKKDNVDNELLEMLNEMKMEDDEGENSVKVMREICNSNYHLLKWF